MTRLITTATLLIALLNSALPVHAQKHRLKHVLRSEMTLNNGWAQTDSAVFYYSGNMNGEVPWQWAESLSRGWTYLHFTSHLQYDSVLNKVTNVNANHIPQVGSGVYLGVQQHNSAGQVTSYKQYGRPLTSGSFKQIGSNTYTYTGADLTEAILDGSTKNVYKYQNGLLQSMEVYNKLNNTFSLYSIYTYNYNQAGNIEKVRYNRILPGDSSWTLYTYNNQNQVSEMLSVKWSWTPQPDTSRRVLYTYSNGDLVQEDIYGIDWPNTNLYHRATLVSSYDNLHRKTEMTSHYRHYSAQPLDPRERRTFTYDNNNLLIKLENQNWDGSQWISRADSSAYSSSQIYIFGYEEAWPASIPPMQDDANVKLYPSPTSDFIRIEANWKEAKPFTVAIHDMQGRILRQWNEPATKTYARTMPLTELPSGMYIIRLHCGNEHLTRQFSISK